MPFSSEQLGAWAELAVNWGLNILGAVAILVVGWIVAGWAARMVSRLGERSTRIDKTVNSVLARMVRLGILVVTLLAVLDRFGIETTSIIALLGAAGLAIGLALQGSLANVAAGVMILGLRPFKLGDAVDVGGTAGAVEDIGLFTTRLRTFDGVVVHMPNGRIWGSEIKNFSQAVRRRIDLTVGIGYGDDMDEAIRIVQAMLEEEERILSEPAPLIAVDALGDSSVNVLARFWVLPANFLQTRLDLTKRVKERFDAAGISIPFPQRDVHIVQNEPLRHEAAD